MNTAQKLTKLIQEMGPQVIGRLPEKELIVLANTIWQRDKHTFKITDIPDLMFKGDEQAGIYMFVRHDIVNYYMEYESKSYRKLLHGRQLRQLLAVRHKSSAASAGIAKRIFFEKLLPVYKGLITDTRQTSDGKDFWQYAISEGIRNPDKYDVWVLDRRNQPNKAIQINSFDEFDEYSNVIWGEALGFKQILAALIQK